MGDKGALYFKHIVWIAKSLGGSASYSAHCLRLTAYLI